jgi:cyclic pyranopterin monophosphate synthase
VGSFTHIDTEGRVRMVDVGNKPPTDRRAVAQSIVVMQPETFDRITDRKIKKGNVLETARIAGVMAAKKTADLIPMCHPLNLRHVEVNFYPEAASHRIRIEAAVRVIDQTGVEMEALTAATVAALTIYDMCKSYDRGMAIVDTWLLSKSGGKSGDYTRGTSDGAT